ncbi:unnamed protein product, partial [Closterium sp. NIES-65]
FNWAVFNNEAKWYFNEQSPGALDYNVTDALWFLNRFNWAVFNNEAKWYFNEQSPGALDYNVTDALVRWFTQRNIKVRAHNIFWAVEKFVQTWVKGLNNTSLWAAMQRRMSSAVSRYRGKVQHWDVINEPLHGNYYGQRLGGNVHSWMFKAARAIDPNVRLFLNEYNTVEQCDKEANPEIYLEVSGRICRQVEEKREVQQNGECSAAALNEYNTVEQCDKDANPKVRLKHGLNRLAVAGMPIWLTELDFNEMVRLKHDLNRLAVAGMPIWLTELDFNEVQSGRQRADYLEAVMREAFAHPSVAGIVLWSAGRSTCMYYKDMDPGMCSACDACLANDKFVDNLAGQR